MDLNGISNATSSYINSTTAPTSKNTPKAKVENKTATPDTNTSHDSSKAAVYESSSTSAKTVYKQDTATVERLKADAEARTSQLRSLVEKMMTKQGQAFNKGTDIYQLLREGKLTVDSATAAQAQKDISEDGYWGAEKTSDRLVEFAKALSGGDPEKADLMIKSVKEGFKQAAKAWGGELPSLCNTTYDKTMEKLNEWKNSSSKTTETQQ